MSVRLPVCPSHETTDFHIIWYLGIFRKSVKKIQVPIKSDKNNGYVTWRPIYVSDHISLISSLNETCSDKRCRENGNTHYMSNNFFRKPCHLWDNVENIGDPERLPLTIWRMGIACCIIKATNTHSEYVISIVFPLQQWLHERASMLRYMYSTLPVLLKPRWMVFIHSDSLVIEGPNPITTLQPFRNGAKSIHFHHKCMTSYSTITPVRSTNRRLLWANKFD